MTYCHLGDKSTFSFIRFRRDWWGYLKHIKSCKTKTTCTINRLWSFVPLPFTLSGFGETGGGVCNPEYLIAKVTIDLVTGTVGVANYTVPYQQLNTKIVFTYM